MVQKEGGGGSCAVLGSWMWEVRSYTMSEKRTQPPLYYACMSNLAGYPRDLTQLKLDGMTVFV